MPSTSDNGPRQCKHVHQVTQHKSWTCAIEVKMAKEENLAWENRFERVCKPLWVKGRDWLGGGPQLGQGKWGSGLDDSFLLMDNHENMEVYQDSRGIDCWCLLALYIPKGVLISFTPQNLTTTFALFHVPALWNSFLTTPQKNPFLTATVFW